TWISLLAEAASLTGFRVLTIATKPSGNQFEEGNGQLEDNGEPGQIADGRVEPQQTAENNHSAVATTNVLASPMQVTEKLTGPNSQPMVHIPLPGWVWN